MLKEMEYLIIFVSWKKQFHNLPDYSRNVIFFILVYIIFIYFILIILILKKIVNKPNKMCI